VCVCVLVFVFCVHKYNTANTNTAKGQRADKHTDAVLEKRNRRGVLV